MRSLCEEHSEPPEEKIQIRWCPGPALWNAPSTPSLSQEQNSHQFPSRVFPSFGTSQGRNPMCYGWQGVNEGHSDTDLKIKWKPTPVMDLEQLHPSAIFPRTWDEKEGPRELFLCLLAVIWALYGYGVKGTPRSAEKGAEIPAFPRSRIWAAGPGVKTIGLGQTEAIRTTRKVPRQENEVLPTQPRWRAFYKILANAYVGKSHSLFKWAVMVLRWYL